MELSDRLQHLNAKNQQKILNLLSKLENKETLNEQTESIEPTEGKQDRSVRRPPITQVQKISEQGTPSQKTGQIGRISKKNKKVNRQSQVKHGQPGKKQARLEPISITEDRPNLFLEQGFAGLHQKDIKIDQKLTGNNPVTQRNTRNDLIEIECDRCGDLWRVSTKMIYRDDEGLHFICDDCQKR